LSLLWPGVGTGDPDAALPGGFEGQRLQFELLVVSPVVAVVLAATICYLSQRAGSTDEIPAQMRSAVVRPTSSAPPPPARKGADDGLSSSPLRGHRD
jgi:hypothetical protein